MKLEPMPPYFLVKINRKKIDSVGSIIIPDAVKFMAFNLQCGEILSIGKEAAAFFPEAKVGHTLIMHHFCEGMNEEDAKSDHLIYWDDDYGYYVVTAFEFNGKGAEAYGVWDGEKIIPSPEYIFLKKKIKQTTDVDLEKLKDSDYKPDGMSVSGSGLLLFNDWEDSREEKERKQWMLKKEIEDLSKTGNHKKHIRQGIKEKEIESEKISQDINRRAYTPFKVSFYNPEILDYCVLYKNKNFTPKTSILPDDDIYVLNIAAHTEVTFMDITYIVAKSKYAVIVV